MNWSIICITLLFSSLLHLRAEDAALSISGRVFLDGIPCAHVEVLIGGTPFVSESTAKGHYELNGLKPGYYVIYAFHPDGMTEAKGIDLKKSMDDVNFNLKASTIVLDEVTISALKKGDQLRLNPIKAEIIDVSQSLQKATNVQTLLNTSPGVKLRNSGALGASNEVIINGFSGRSIKLMRNGIPLDYLGSSFGITKIPVNSIDRMEVYKGVLPTELGVDALGGAINLVDRQYHGAEVQFSLEKGSFNSNIATISGFHRLKKHLAVGMFAFYNYSDNDYKVGNLPFIDHSTGRNTYIEARLFHNMFKQHFAEGYVHIDGLPWADLIELRVTTFGMHQDVQNDFTNRSRAFGGVYRTEKTSVIPALTYQKSLFTNKVYMKHFAVYSNIEKSFVDTLQNVYYDWKGVKHSSISSSEIGRTNPLPKGKNSVDSDDKNFIYRGLVTYTPVKGHKLTVNIVNNYLQSTRDDENRGYKPVQINYNRLVAGVGYDANWLGNRLNTIVQLKSMQFRTQGRTSEFSNRLVTIDKKGISLSLSAKYDIAKHLLVRGAYENTYRLPDQMEIFGDNSFILANLNLKPEQSKNYNMGIKFHEGSKYNFEINGYYRNTQDLIKLKELNQFQGSFLNLEMVKGYGIELEGMYRPATALRLMGNLTYNEFRYNGSLDENANDQHYQDARISNTPFYYGNLGAEYVVRDLLGQTSRLRTYWNYSYVHYYYLDYIEKQYEPDGFLGLTGKSKIATDRIFPQQHLHTTGVSLDVKVRKEDRMTVGVEVRNLFDKEIYNNFKMQSPGRSVWVKAAYTIK